MKTLMFGEVIEELCTGEIEGAIRKRREARDLCVGTLYPSIVGSEIGLLYDELARRRREEGPRALKGDSDERDGHVGQGDARA